MVLAGVWLVSLYYAIRPLLELDIWSQVLGFSCIAVFVPVYLSGFRTLGAFVPIARRPARLVGLGVLLACTLVLGVVSLEASLTLCVFMIAYSVFTLWRPLSYIAALSVTSGAIGTLVWLRLLEQAPTVVTSMLVILVGGTVTVTMIEGSAKADALQRENAVIAERDRMARDVHDLIGHSLTVVNLKAQLAQRLLDTDPAQAHAELAEIQAIVSEALGGVRRTVTEARSSSIEDELVSAGDALASADVAVEIVGDAAEVWEPIKLVSGWVLREATTNVLRHAHASRCRFTFASTRMTIEDDGDGMHGREGNGVRGMRERVSAAGGRLSVGASELGGTKVEVAW